MRGLEALVARAAADAGAVDRAPAEQRRPVVARQRARGPGLRELFAYGGYGYFDNMNAFFDANDYRVVDRRDIP